MKNFEIIHNKLNTLIGNYNWDLDEMAENLPFIDKDQWVITGVEKDRIYLYGKTTKRSYTVYANDYKEGIWYLCPECGKETEYPVCCGMDLDKPYED